MLFPSSAPRKKERRRSSSSQSLLWVPEELENQANPNVSWFLASRNYGMGSKTMPKRDRSWRRRRRRRRRRSFFLTAWALVLDGGHSAFLAPVNGIRSFDIGIAKRGTSCCWSSFQSPILVDLCARVPGAELLVRHVRELIESQRVGRVLLLVMRVHVQQIFLENAKPVLLLSF